MSNYEFVPVGKCNTITERKPEYVDLPPNTKGYLTEKVETALKTPMRIVRKLPSGEKVESWAKQIVVSSTIRLDETLAEFRWKYKAEVSFDMSPRRFDEAAAPTPFLSTNKELFARDGADRRHSLNPFPPGHVPGFLRRPDVIIVRNPVVRWPGRNSADREGVVHADNLLRLVEIKFPGDDWARGQETAYQQIAGGKNRMSVLDVSDCNGDLEEAKRKGGATNPSNAPIFFPPPDNVPPPDAIPVPVGDDAGGEGTKDKEPKDKGPNGIPVRVPARSVTPIAEKVWYEPWLNDMDNARTEVARAVASLWDDTRDGLSTMSAQARDWARAHAPWLVEAGRWMRDTGSKTWQWIDATGRTLYSYTDAQLRTMWAMVQEATDLTWDMLKAIDWGQVVTLVKNVAKGLCVLALVVVGAYVVYVLAAAVFAALAALVALASAASAAGAAALAMLGAALGVGLATAP
jgi:hypothetical protein